MMLTATQSRIYHALLALTREQLPDGTSPTVSEIAERAQASRGYTYSTLRLLTAQGWLRQHRGKFRPAIALPGDQP